MSPCQSAVKKASNTLNALFACRLAQLSPRLLVPCRATYMPGKGGCPCSRTSSISGQLNSHGHLLCFLPCVAMHLWLTNQALISHG